MPSITKIAADRLTVKKGRKDFFDPAYPGLALRVSDSGRKAWTYFYRIKNGKVHQRRLTLGTYPALDIAMAHDAWRKAYDLVQAGRDPAVADTKLPVLSFAGVVAEWLKKDQAENRTGKFIERRFNNHVLPAWEGRLITDIDRRACLDLIDTIADRGTVVLARRVFSHLHRLFVWCIGRGIIEVNPLQHAEKPGSETSRTRVLTDAELLKVLNAAEKLSPSYRDAFKLLVLTGARKQEISGLRWSELVDASITLEGERTKNGEPHIIPLSSAARSVQANVAKLHDIYVFPTVNGTPVFNWTKAKHILDRESGVTNWVIHDLRRTIATGLQKLGVQLVVTEAILGHSGGSRGGIVGVYQRHDYAAEKAAALEAWGAHVVALVEGEPRGKVTAFRRTKGEKL
jgi:integrase